MNRILVLCVLFLGALFHSMMAQTIRTVGTGGDYSTLAAAFSAVNDKTLTGEIELQIVSSITHNATATLYGVGSVGALTTQIDVTSGEGYALGDLVIFSAPDDPNGVTASGRVSRLYGGTPAGRIWEIEVTEPGSGYTQPPTITIQSTNGTGANPTVWIGGDYASLSIYPTVANVTLSGSLQAPIIDLVGADHVTIDGRLNRTGTTRDLTLQNTNSLLNSPVIRMMNLAESNQLLYTRYLGVRSERIILSATANGKGVNDILVQHCLISTLPGAPSDSRYGLYVIGNSTNQNVQIRNNEFENIMSNASWSIALFNGATNVDIEDNHIYVNQTFSFSGNPRMGIRLFSGNNVNIKNNYIGGSEPFAQGAPWTFSATGNSFTAIFVDGSNEVSIQGNTIKNFDLTLNSGGFTGISSTSPNVYIGTEAGNVIGDLEAPSSILCGNCNIVGINVAGNNIPVNNNILGGWEAGAYLFGILKVSGTGEVKGNTIANTKLRSTATADIYRMIESRSTSGADVLDNYIYNLMNESSRTVVGINAYGGTVGNNLVHLTANGVSEVRGISKINSGILNLYHNTVVIDGAVDNSAFNTYALFDNRTDSRNYRNNLWVNKASSNGESMGKNYAISLSSAPAVIDYNNYFVSGTNGVLGLFANNDRINLGEWKTSTNKDCFSLDLDPDFPSPSGNAVLNFLPSNPAMGGTPISTLPKDILENDRSATLPAIGALEYSITEVAPAYAITAFTPEQGMSGTEVTISGFALGAVTAVRFNGVNATSFVIVDDNTLTAIVPSTATTGKISVVSLCGTVLSEEDFEVLTVPSAPTNLVGTPGFGQVSIAFTPGTSGSSPITNYQYSLDGGQTWISFVPAVTSSPVVITNLVNGTSYSIQIRAINATEEGESSAALIVVPGIDWNTIGALDIVESGGDAEGTTWVYMNDTLAPLSSNAVVNASDIVAKLLLGPLTVVGSSINVNGSIASTTAHTLVFQTGVNIFLAAGKTIVTAGGDVILWADADDNRAGGIRIGSDFAGIFTTAIATHGGDIILSGGADLSTGYAHYHAGLGAAQSIYHYAIGIFGATLDARGDNEGGNIIIRGSGGNTFNGLLWTVNIGGQYGANTKVLTKGTGTITVIGDGSEAPANPTPTNSRNSWATVISATLETESGNIDLVGLANVARTNARGWVLSGTTQSLSGAITAEDRTANTASANYTGPFINGAKFGKGLLMASTSNVWLIADKFAFEGNVEVTTSGEVVVEPYANSFAGPFSLINLEVLGGASSLRLGKNTNTQNITLGKSQTINGPISIIGGTLAINAALTASNADIHLHATGTVSQTAAMSAQGLGLHGPAQFTLNNASNSFVTLAGGTLSQRIGGVNFTNGNTSGMSIETVGSLTGLWAQGDILVETLEGNIDVLSAISSLSTNNSTTGYFGALILNAGRNSSTGEPAGGNVRLLTGASLQAPSGIVKLYSGNKSESTGLVDFVGGEENVRYAVDETTLNFDPALSSLGQFALFRAFDCLNPTDGGVIGDAQSICSGTAPGLLINLSAPAGFVGNLEFIWQSNTTPTLEESAWTLISGAVDSVYQPGVLTQTTSFRRLAKVDCQVDWLPSNAVEIFVNELPLSPFMAEGTPVNTPFVGTVDFDADHFICGNEEAVYGLQLDNSSLYSVSWSVSGGGSIVAGQNAPAVKVLWSQPGEHILSYLVTRLSTGCQSEGSLLVTVDEEAPILSCQNITVALNANGQYSMQPNEPILNILDDCAIVNLEVLGGSAAALFTCANIGLSNSRTVVATDGAGNEGSCTFFVTVVDLIAPTPPNAPANATFSCVSQVPAPGVLVASDNCGPVSALGVDSNNGGLGCADSPLVITRTWTFVDGSGNSASIAQTLTVIDEIAPVIGVPAAALSVECDGSGNTAALNAWLANRGGAMATDNCSAVVWSNNYDAAQFVGTCGGAGAVTVVFTATDACGNSATTQAVFTIVDSTPPSVSIANPAFLPSSDGILYIECGQREEGWEYPVLGSSDIATSDNCSEVSLSILEQNTVSNDCANLGYLMEQFYTITATDACGNASQIVLQVRLIDTQAPAIRNVPSGLTLSCTEEIPAAPALGDCENFDTNTVWAQDGCGCPEVVFTEEIVNGNCAGNYDLIRRWTATDPCGNATTAQQIIQIRDTEGPSLLTRVEELQGLVSGASVDIDCITGEDNYSWISQLNSQSFEAIGGCSGVQNLLFSAEVFEQGSCQTTGALETRRFRWTATDACGNALVFDFFVRYVDQTGPVIQGPEILCSTDLALAGVTASDACSEVIAMDSDLYLVGMECGSKVYERVWFAYDACYNVSTFTQTIYENLNTLPQISFEQGSELANPAFVEVFVDCKESGIEEFYLQTPFSASSACDLTLSKRVQVEEEELENCMNGVLRRSVITWMATDLCGNMASRSLTIHYTDRTRPVFLNNDRVIEVECYEEAISPQAVDLCSEANVFLFTADIPDLPACSGRYDVQEVWVAEDACGNTNRFQRTVKVNKTTAPEILNIEPFLCQGDLQPEPIVGNACNTVFDVTVENGVSDPNNCGYYSFATRIYKVMDDCGNSNTYTQQVITGDNASTLQIVHPTLGNLEEGITYRMACNSPTTSVQGLFLASDIVAGEQCYGEGSVSTRLLLPGDCLTDGYYGIYEVIYLWANVCGVEKTTRIRVILEPSNQPMAVFVPQDVEVFCANEYTPEDLIFNSYCSETTLDYAETSQSFGNQTVLTRLWTLTGNCGKVETYTQRITYYEVEREVEIVLPQNTLCDNINGASAKVQGLGNFVYLWEVVQGDAVIVGAPNQSSIKFSMGWSPFVLRLTVKDAFGCVTVEEIEVRCQYEVEIRGEETAASVENVNLYPNPVIQRFTLEWTASSEEFLEYQILSQEGKILLKGGLHQSIGDNRREFSVQALGAGVFYLRFTNAQQEVVLTRIFIKTN